MRAVAIAEAADRCLLGASLAGVVGAEIQDPLEKRSECRHVSDEHAESGFGVAPDQDVS